MKVLCPAVIKMATIRDENGCYPCSYIYSISFSLPLYLFLPFICRSPAPLVHYDFIIAIRKNRVFVRKTFVSYNTIYQRTTITTNREKKITTCLFGHIVQEREGEWEKKNTDPKTCYWYRNLPTENPTWYTKQLIKYPKDGKFNMPKCVIFAFAAPSPTK